MAELRTIRKIVRELDLSIWNYFNFGQSLMALLPFLNTVIAYISLKLCEIVDLLGDYLPLE
jgi:hypothetical protein